MAKEVTKSNGTTAKVLKAMGVFGSVQSLTMLCSVVRTKLVALWIGPAGVGLLALYWQTMDLLGCASQLNLRQSAVRDISTDGDKRGIVSVVRRLSVALGLAGAVVCMLGAPALSMATFGDSSHTLAFVALSVMLLFTAIASGEWAVMQGMGRLKLLARSTLYATLTSTAVAIPLFYFLRLGGIVPVLITFALSNCTYALIMRVKDTGDEAMSIKEAFGRGRKILALGAYMTVSMALTMAASYLFVVWLNRQGGDEAVGIYQAGYTIVNSYVGVIFTAIVMEYYPRLSAVAGSRLRCEVIVSHEIKVTMLVLIPVIVLFIAFKGLIVNILYSHAFDAVLPYLGIAIIGVGLRGASWCMAYAILARGDGRVYVFTELSSAVSYLALNIPMYLHFGYRGLGVAYVMWYGAYAAVCYGVYRYRYGLRLRRGVAWLVAASVAAGGAALWVSELMA